MAAQPQEGETQPGAACMPQAHRPQRPPPEAALLQLQGQCIPFGSVSCPRTERRPTSSVLGGSSWSRCLFTAQRLPFPPGRRAAPRGTNPSQSTEGFLQGASPSPAGRHMGDREGLGPLFLPSTRFSPQPAHCPPCRPQWEHAAHHLTTSCLRWSLRPQSRKWGAGGGGGEGEALAGGGRGCARPCTWAEHLEKGLLAPARLLPLGCPPKLSSSWG